MKKMIALLLALAMAFALAACGTADDEPAGSDAGTPGVEDSVNYDRNGDGEVVVAYSCIAYSIAILPQYLYSNLKDTCDARGWTFISLAAEGDAMLQGEQVSQLVQQDPDYFVLFPADPALAEDWVQEIGDAGIPCVTVHTDAADNTDGNGNSNVLGYCGPNNYQMAYDLGMALIEANGADAGLKIVEIGGLAVQSDYIERVQGFADAIAEHSNYEILGIEWAGSSRADAQTYMENFIGTYGDEIDVLMGFDDDLTLGGVNALQEANMTDVQVYSITGQIEAMEAIQNGTMTCTAFYTTANEIADVFAIIDAYAAGEDIGAYAHDTLVINVTSENVADYADQAEF